MPYKSKSDLPTSLQDNLPEHAQDIYKEAFNSAWKTYEDAEDRNGDDDRETVAHKVAWSAVKESYNKNSNDRWVKS